MRLALALLMLSQFKPPPPSVAAGAALQGQANPSAPTTGTLHYDLLLDAGFPAMPFLVNAVDARPMPDGIHSFFMKQSTSSSWDVSCIIPWEWGQTTFSTQFSPAPTVTGTAGSVAWASTSLLTRSKQVTAASAASLDNSGCVASSSSTESTWRGNTAGAGGFFLWHRFNLNDTKANARVFVGLIDKTTGLTGNPSAETDTVYVGCDDGDTNLSICSNDNSGAATCTTLGASFPATTDGVFYDLWLYAPPNGSSISYLVERLDSPGTPAAGLLTADLPRNTVQLNWRACMNTGATTSTAVKLGHLGTCILSNL